MKVTIWENIYDKTARHISVDGALDRIINGRSEARNVELRATIDAARAKSIKEGLPVVAFSGVFKKRGDKHLEQHSGLLVLDFDKLDEVGEKIAQLQAFPHTYACWVSPSGSGAKALIRIADGSKHREHFAALKEVFPDADPSGVNEERLCYESYDPHLFRNKEAVPFTKTLTVKQVVERVETTGDEAEKFSKLLKWIANKGEAFTSGSRNTFIFKLAGACCRFGMDAQVAGGLIAGEFQTGNDFTMREMMNTVKSAYRTNAPKAGTVRFEHERVVDITSRKDVKVKDLPDFDPETPPRDVIYAEEVLTAALDIYDNGYRTVSGVGVPELDMRWKPKRGEMTCLTGYGNVGKSAWWKWYQLLRVLLFGERFASFSPEDNPPAEYYHDFVEMLLGCDCTPGNPHRPSREIYEQALRWIGKHIFYLYPKDDVPTPALIKERFLELIVKEKVDGVTIDPFNQLANDYGGRSDKYLEQLFGDFDRFAQANMVYFMIIAHPTKATKDANGNYPCPDRYDLADGAMWNNKMYNILVYHRPFMATSPDDPTAEFHSKKIKRQKTVGRPGYSDMRYQRSTRRFEFGNDDPIERAIKIRGLDFWKGKMQPIIQPQQTDNTPLILPDDFWNN